VAQMWGTAFDAITDLHITGTERFKQLWGGLLSTVLQVINRMIAEAIAAKLALETIFSSMGLGTLIPLGIIGGLVLSNNFHEGGYVPGQAGGEQMAMLRNQEYVMPPGPTAMFRPLLDEMRAGRLPRLATRSGAGGTVLETHVHVAPGSILYAHDEIGVRAIAEQVNRSIEKTVKKAYRE
jgi:hypothetical protein